MLTVGGMVYKGLRAFLFRRAKAIFRPETLTAYMKCISERENPVF